jgi:quercetin dioxygenase-like cupin family protein
MAVERWNQALDGPFSEGALRRKLEAAGWLVARYTYPPGTHFPDHTHDTDKVDAVVSGRFRIVLNGHLYLLGPGDWIAVPRGARHSASVVGDAPVVSLDAVKPPASRG